MAFPLANMKQPCGIFRNAGDLISRSRLKSGQSDRHFLPVPIRPSILPNLSAALLAIAATPAGLAGAGLTGTGLAQSSPSPTLSTPAPRTTASPTPEPKPSPASPDQPKPLLEKLQAEATKHVVPLGLLLLGSYLGIWLIRPRWLLKLPTSDLTVPIIKWKMPLSVVRFLKYRDRALDSWVEQHWKIARDQFLQLPTVQARQIHIALPVCRGQKPNLTLINELRGTDLQPTFQKKSAVLLIVGEGGAGKTSLACQIAQWGLKKELARHRLLPVLIETELEGEKAR